MSVQLDCSKPPVLTTIVLPAGSPAVARPGRWLVGGLVGLNLLLGVGLFFRLHDTPAYGAAGGRGDYLVVTGRSGNAITLYALETATGKLRAIRQEPTQNRTILLSTADVADDLERAFPKK